jgi:hypothetical protein
MHVGIERKAVMYRILVIKVVENVNLEDREGDGKITLRFEI